MVENGPIKTLEFDGSIKNGNAHTVQPYNTTYNAKHQEEKAFIWHLQGCCNRAGL